MQSGGSSPESQPLALATRLEDASSTNDGSPCSVPGAGMHRSRSAALVAVQRQQMAALAKAGQENAILAGFRKQMETLEDKLSAEITRSHQKGDLMRETAIARCDSKLGVLEANQPRVDRRLAEVTGNLRGLSDEVQGQIRRIDQTDSRLYEWRHQLEEEIRAKFTEVEQNYQNMASTMRVNKTSTDELSKKYNQRLLRLEGMMEEHVVSAEDTNQSILQLHTRLTGVEDAGAERSRAMAITLSPHSSSSILQGDLKEKDSGTVSVASMEKQVAELQRQMDIVQTQNHDLQTLVESQGERYKSLRTLGETKEEQYYKMLNEGLGRGSVDDRLKELQASVRDFEGTRTQTSEQMELLQRRLDAAHATNEELSNSIRRMQERSTEALAGMTPLSPPSLAVGLSFEGASPTGEAGECAERLKDVEELVGTLGVQIETIREDQELGSRVAALVGALKDISPKVINHDSLLRQLQQDLGEAMNLCTQRHKGVERTVTDVRRHMDRLTREVDRIISEIDGPGVGLAAATILEHPLAEEEAEAEAEADVPPRRATQTE